MSQIQRVKDATEIVEIIGERLQLQKAGSYWKANCPFHSEKTPSFFVSENIQRYKCFGCGESGDVFTFLEKYEHMTFYEALEYLADRANIKLEKQVRSQQDDRRLEQLAVLELAKNYYHYLLTEHQLGKNALKYLKDRGVSAQSIKLFQLGYAPAAWDGLTTFLSKKKKKPMALLKEVGLVSSGRGGRYYDRFRDRIIFPLKDHRGRVVGFSGRSLNPEAKEAKYINSPETALYHKSHMLYGFHELKNFIRKKSEVVVTEGEFDVISSAQAGVNHVVAIKGSAFTQDHAKLLKRVVKRIILALDTDQAGIKATERAIKVLEPEEIELRVAVITQGKDPDDLARKKPKAWRKAVEANISAYQFLIDQALLSHDITQGRGKSEVIRKLAPVLATIESQVEKEYYVKQLANRLDTRLDVLLADLEKFSKKLSRISNRSVNLAKKEDQNQPQKTTTIAKIERLGRYLIFLLTQARPNNRSSLAEEAMDLLDEFGELKAIVSWLAGISDENDFKSQLKSLAVDRQELLMSISLDPEFIGLGENLKFDKEWSETIERLSELMKQKRREKISAELEELDRIKNKTKAQEKRMEQLLRELA